MRREDALEYHRGGRRGKLEVVPTKPLNTQRDLALAYSPGVAEPCRDIHEDEALGWEYTARGNLVAVITNGTAVLGLGDIGPLAGKPVMEGKACLFKKFADVDVFDLEIAETDPDKLVEIICALEPTFGGINLEDIKAPECFEVEAKLRERLSIPVFHDDQHGTAIISGAALLNACEIADKSLDSIKIVCSGAGASAIACVTFFESLGVQRKNIALVDSKGLIHEGRSGLNSHKQRFAVPDTGKHTLADALEGADVFLGLSIGGLVSKDMITSMADRPIVFALANPDPEISYPDALEAKPDALVATGRSDFPNQVNNVLGFPYIFRGALDVRARRVTEEMKIAAARALAALAHEPVPPSVLSAYGDVNLVFGPEYLIPTPFDERVLWWVAPAVARAAMDSGVARETIDIDAYREKLNRTRADASYFITRRLTRAARRNPKKIVFPEAANPKVLRAAQIVLEDGIAEPVLVGRNREIHALCEELHLDIASRVPVIQPRDSSEFESYSLKFYELRQRKGVSLAFARSLVSKSNYFGMMMVREGDADGIVSGLKITYPETIRPALQILGRRPNTRVALGMYMMVLKDTVKFFADPTINLDPSAEVLADIAVQTADAVEELGVKPRVAMISFSNFGSVDHPEPRKVRAALALIRAARPELEIDGEMQADIALNRDKMVEQFSFCQLSGTANVLIFSTLGAANASYKVLQTIGGADTFGPILLGIDKPIAVLQPQASVNSIVNMTAYTVMIANQRSRA